ncbi:unnamed protein product [Toxocara canis]|uniref:ABC transporter permease n=1 Tax=Toxocara canis TaxID=6265 RepID=A0A183V5C2_TOXCA|nr:unnamed protein product [Toxocara canis]
MGERVPFAVNFGYDMANNDSFVRFIEIFIVVFTLVFLEAMRRQAYTDPVSLLGMTSSRRGAKTSNINA